MLQKSDYQIEVVVVDVTESPIERPKKNRSIFYSGKKKQHTLKSLLVVEQTTGKIICTEGIFRRNNSSEKMPPHGRGS